MLFRLFLSVIFSINIMLSFSQEKAEYRQEFTQGNLLFLEKNYPMALQNFLKAYSIDSSNANINYKLGVCYLQSILEKNKAIPFLEKAIQNISEKYDDFEPREKKAPTIAYYYLGEAYHLSYRFEEAIVNFEKYKSSLSARQTKSLKNIDRQIEMCHNGMELIKDAKDILVVNLGDSINTAYPEYGPVISMDESMLIFTSRNPNSTGGKKTSNNQFYEDIYVSYRKKDKTWSTPVSIGDNINTEGNEASISLSADGQQLFIYKDINGGDIYTSNLEGENWTKPVPLGSNINTKGWETHACLSADRNTLYFASDRKGGYGGRDIYRCVKLPNGQWSMALNLGDSINTEYDEDSPFIHADGVTLFFSSEGHNSMGGFDIFYSTKGEGNSWKRPINLGYPINTTDDDIFYTPSIDGKRAYYASAKASGYGDKDIYQINLSDAIVETVALLKGTLVFNGSDKIPADVRITATDIETDAIVQEVRPNSKTGKYILTLNAGADGKKYNISFEAEGYQPISEQITIEPGASYQELEKELNLKPVNFEKELGTIAVNGSIKNQNGKVIPGAKIIIKDNKTGNLIDTYYTQSDTGKYHFVLQRGNNYNLSYEAEGYLFRSENVNVPKEPTYSELTKNIVLESIKPDIKITLNNIFFDYNKTTLRKESKTELEQLKQFIQKHPELTFEVAGHTDNKGKEAINIKISQLRAESVVNYLIKKGIDKRRLIAKGYGETTPIADNTLPNGKPNPEGMQMNRRVEFKILESIQLISEEKK